MDVINDSIGTIVILVIVIIYLIYNKYFSKKTYTFEDPSLNGESGESSSLKPWIILTILLGIITFLIG